MISQLDNAAMMRADTAGKEPTKRSPLGDVLARVREVLEICDRAGAAAHRYEELRVQSDEDLAAQGLSRSDLPRKAFEDIRG